MNPTAEREERQSLLALVLSILVGPLGVAWGLVLLTRRPSPRARALATAAVVVGVVQTLVVGLVLANALAPRGGTPGGPPASPPSVTAAPSSTVGPAPEATPSSSPSSSSPTSPIPAESPPPPQTAAPSSSWPTGDVGSFLEPEVAGYEARGFTPDPAATTGGAIEAYEGTYGNQLFEIEVHASSWASRQAAEQAVLTTSQNQFPDREPLKVGEVGSPDVVGRYRYYERDGVATMFWNDGNLMVIATGKPLAVQEFFVLHPRRG